MTPFENEIAKTFYFYEGSTAVEGVRGPDGVMRTAPVKTAEVQSTGVAPEEQTNPEAIAGESADLSVGEFVEKVTTVGAGALTGAAAVTAGLPRDIYALGRGIYDSLGAEEGEKFAAFVETVAKESASGGFVEGEAGLPGSEYILKKIQDYVGGLDLTEEQKAEFIAGSKYLGEWAELPGAATAIAKTVKGLRSYAAGAPARVAERGTGLGTLSSGIDPQKAIDEIIVGIQKATTKRKRNKLVSFIQNNPDGFTLDLAGQPTPTQGFVVAPLKETEIFIDSQDLSPDTLEALVDNVVALTQASGGKVYAGGWFDEETGRYVLDAVQVVDNKDDALYLAAAGDQDAIFDLGEFNVIRTEDGLIELKESNAFDVGRYNEQRANQAKLVEGFAGSGIPDQAATATAATTRAAAELGSPQETNIVSTRLPTSKDAPEDPLAARLQVGIESSKADPKTYAKNANLVKDYPNIRNVGDDPEAISQELVEHAKQNLLYLFDAVPEATRQRSKLWYEGARKITDDLSGQYQIPDRSVAAVMAVLSPQRDWFMNVSLGKRVLQIHMEKANEPWTKEMSKKAKQIFGQKKYAPILQGITGKSYSELETVGEKAMWLRIYDEQYNPRSHEVVTPEGEFSGIRLTGKGEEQGTAWGSLDQIAKAISVIEDPSIENISNRLGNQHKVRNFYNNIFAPMDEAGDVTIDTHAVAAALLRPLSGNSIEVSHNFGTKAKGSSVPGGSNNSVAGSNGTYGLFAEAYRQAAKERGVLPREMQSITWEAVRGLFAPGYKGQASNVEYIDNVWRQYKSGDLTLEEARDAVIKHAGGIDAPEWERSAGATAPEIQNPGDAGELSRAGSSRKKTSGPGRGRNSRATRSNQTKRVNTESPGSGMEGDQ